MLEQALEKALQDIPGCTKALAYELTKYKFWTGLYELGFLCLSLLAIATFVVLVGAAYLFYDHLKEKRHQARLSARMLQHERDLELRKDMSVDDWMNYLRKEGRLDE
jgi:hypothetical protein